MPLYHGVDCNSFDKKKPVIKKKSLIGTQTLDVGK